ncbi:MAG TPA: hypothetical protein VHT05_05470 [Candidatus Elarobacter sp.]|nr:hypothetical protein [Candidatus Elarobacter sp.]
MPAWQSACVRALLALDGVSVDVIAGDGATEFPRGLAGRLAGPAFARTRLPAPALRRPNAPHACDVVLDLTGSARALGAPQGRWFFRIGEDGGGAAPFAREIARGDNTVDVELVRQFGAHEELIRRGRFSVARLYASTLRWALFEAARWPASFVAALRDGRELDTVPCAPRPLRAPAAGADRIRFALRLALRFGGYFVEKLFEISQWNVGLIAGEPRLLLEPGPLDVQWLPRPQAATFIADPFVVERDGRRAILVEQYAHERDRGVIEAIEVDRAGAVVRRETIIDLPAHLSYPYPLELDGALYLVPESSTLNEVASYRCVEFPWRWERGPAIFPAFDGLDTTLFEHDGRWWAMCTRVSRGPTLALFAYFADSPRGPWREHALNPIVVDVSSARPAGQPFSVDGVLYRPGQSSADSYGCGMAIARIDLLTPEHYRETIVRRIELGGAYAGGTHTLSFAGATIAIDGKHRYHDLRKPLWGLSRAAKRVARRGERARAHPSPA